jgi:hypothetical protein
MILLIKPPVERRADCPPPIRRAAGPFATGKRAVSSRRIKGILVSRLQIFGIRFVIGIIVAALLARFFRPDAGVPYIIGMAIILVGLAYFAEYLRLRRGKK